VVGRNDGPLRVVVFDQALRRLALRDESVGPTEAAAKERLDRLRAQVGHPV
jgi:hypothetical protein